VLSARRSSGFTIIELLIGITILAIVLGLGAPAMGTYLQNSKLAAATASFYAGVQAARTEAIRRNIQTQFVLTDLPLTTANLANAAGLEFTTGRSWVVRSALPLGGFDPRLVDQKSSNEGEASVVAPSLVVNSIGPAGYIGAIPFNGFGGTVTNQAYRIDISNPAAGACAPGGPVRCRQIRISPGGQISVCDPAAAVGDSRACT
jgi:type IV fimbrial biogenesis protein FimT